MTAVLTQEHGGLQRPVGYYSTKLDNVALGFGSCLRAVQAVFQAIQAVSSLVVDQQLIIKCPHSVHTLLAKRRATQVSASRWGNWQAILEAPNIIIQRATISNPSAMITHNTVEESEHRCEDMISSAEQDQHLKETPLQNLEMVLYTDSSSTVKDGIRYAGWVVTTDCDILKTGSLASGTSAQQAELKALLEACKLAANKTATDSRYAFGVVHDFGLLWKQRGYPTTSGTPVMNGQLVGELMDAIQLPTEVAVIKVKAHTGKKTTEAKGNALADEAARTAARSMKHT